MDSRLQDSLVNLKSTSIPFTAIAVLVGVYFILEYVFGVTQAPNEPPLAKTSIPYIGHTLGLFKHKMKYYVHLSAENRHPIYTVPMMGSKVYVVNQPELAQAIYRNKKTLSFNSLVAEIISRLSAVSKETTKIMQDNVTGERGDLGYGLETDKGMHAALAPGSGLDKINQSIIPDVAAAIDGLVTGTGTARINLYQWVRYAISMATSNAVYGPHNPFKKPGIYEAFWHFENRLTLLLLGILPWLFSPSSYRGRAKVTQAYDAYFRAGHHKEGSDLVNARYDIAMRYRIKPWDIAALETTMSIGILANTAPASFWSIWYVFAHPEVLSDIRREVAAIVTTSKDAEGTTIRHLDLGRLRSDCPVLISTWHEVLRHVGCGTSSRHVREDLMLSGRYFLRKNSVVQMPSQVVHSEASLWQAPTGALAVEPVNTFDHRRFISAKPQPGAYRPFGGGTTLCPGRHLSAMEVQALVAMMVLKLDVVPANGAKWVKPDFFLTSWASAIVSPRQDPVVQVTVREGWEGNRWTFSIPNSRASDKGES